MNFFKILRTYTDFSGKEIYYIIYNNISVNRETRMPWFDIDESVSKNADGDKENKTVILEHKYNIPEDFNRLKVKIPMVFKSNNSKKEKSELVKTLT